MFCDDARYSISRILPPVHSNVTDAAITLFQVDSHSLGPSI